MSFMYSNWSNSYKHSTVEPRYSELIGVWTVRIRKCLDYPEKKKKCTDANTALGIPATWQRSIVM